jgi:hypothetical protein
MTAQSAFTGLLLAGLAAMAVPAPASTTQSPHPDPVAEAAGFSAIAPAGEGWLAAVSRADGRISFTRRSTHQGAVARVTFILIGAIDASARAAGVAGDSLAHLLMSEEVAAARAEGRASGDYRLGDVQVSDTLAERLAVYVLRYRREMTSWKYAGWAEATTVYFYFAPDFPEQHRLMRVQVSERFQVRSTGNQAPDDSATAWSLIQQLQGGGSSLSLR